MSSRSAWMVPAVLALTLAAGCGGEPQAISPAGPSVSVPGTGANQAVSASMAAGAATGAVVGAAVSGPHRAGEGMVLGAIFGAAAGAAAQESRAQANERAYQQAQAQQQAAAAAAWQPMDNFRRAMSACMQGRGYRVG